MEIPARVTSKGQVTVPKPIRDALGLKDGDALIFRLRDGEAVLEPVRSFLDYAGSLKPPADKRGASWEEIRRATWRARARWRR
ncbi:MAG TPA: AbrB/MazE/SpoVT family DNA-binding domain-containing protein [Dehalococcoidia bacterium]|jgi:antitoxin PrlF|nr:AbrB/MazE/SpoVT family DNA-binding domain-containing protein [Dehalococcoidia bacterium]